MRLKQPVRGIHIGATCVDGTEFGEDIAAHAHTSGHRPVGYVCARSKKDLAEFLVHEIAHLASDSGHDDKWRRSVKKLGGKVPAAYKKRPRKNEAKD